VGIAGGYATIGAIGFEGRKGFHPPVFAHNVRGLREDGREAPGEA
jgi:hypothetical protein